MLSLIALSLTAAQSDPITAENVCPVIVLAAPPARSAKLVTTDMSAWRGPMIELQLASTAEETQNFGKLSLIRLAGQIYVGGMLGRRVDDNEHYSFALSFEPEQLAALVAGSKLELEAVDGTILRFALSPVDPAPITECLASNNAPSAPPGDPMTRRNFTFLPLEPNQPLRLRSRGDTSFFYPSSALREAREGSSRIALTIGKSGRIVDCAVVSSSGHEDLDQASCRAARASIFLPETNAAGEPVESKREQNVNWKMGD